MTPASGLYLARAAKSTVDRSTDTNIEPRNRYAGTSTSSPGAAKERLRLRSEKPARDRAGRGAEAGGSVARWAANHSVPPRQQIAAVTTPAAGCSWVASRVTEAGPTMKQSSSAIDSMEKAVCNRDVPASSTDQRAL